MDTKLKEQVVERKPDPAKDAFERLKAAGGKLPPKELHECIEAIVATRDLRYAIWVDESLSELLPVAERKMIRQKIGKSTCLGIPGMVQAENGRFIGQTMISSSDETGERYITEGSGKAPLGFGPVFIRSHIAWGKDGKHAYLTRIIVLDR